MLTCKNYKVALSQYGYIKLFNFIYCNAYNKGGNEYTAVIVKKPMGIIIDSKKTDNYIRIDDVNADLKQFICPGDALIEIDNNVIIGESYRNIKHYMESAKVPFTIRMRNTQLYDKFFSAFQSSKKKPSLETVALKLATLKELLEVNSSATIIQRCVREFITLLKQIQQYRTIYDFVINTLIDHTIAFYSKVSAIKAYYSSYHDECFLYNDGHGGHTGYINVDNLTHDIGHAKTNDINHQRQRKLHHQQQYHRHHQQGSSEQVQNLNELNQTINTPTIINKHLQLPSHIFDVAQVGMMVRIQQPLHLYGYHIPFANFLQTKMNTMAKLWFCNRDECFKYKYFSNNSTAYIIRVKDVQSINIKITKLSASILTQRSTTHIYFDNTIDTSLFHKLVKLIHQ